MGIKYTLLDIACMFMAYAAIGWVWETTYVSFKMGRYTNRGFLRAPIIPIYGFAATTIMIMMSFVEPVLPTEPFLFLVTSIVYIAVVASAWEYVTSFVMEWAFKARWWDYSKRAFNLHGRVALGVSAFWGLGGFALWYFVNTELLSAFRAVPIVALRSIVAVFYFGVLIDATFTLKELINLRAVVIKMHASIGEVIDEIGDRIDEFEENIEVWMDEIEERVALSRIIEKGKKYARFYRNYPNATTRKLPLVFNTLREKIKR